MPEPYWPKRKGSFTLSDSERNGQIIRVTCKYHRKDRFYRPADRKELFGDIQADDLARRMRCDQCGGSGRVDVGTVSPSVAELGTITICRLDRVRWVRQIAWRDEKGA